MKAQLTIQQVSLVSDAALDSRQAHRLSTEIGVAISAAWRAVGQKESLVVDRLVIDAPRAELVRGGFARTVGAAAVNRLLRQRRGD